MVTAEAGHLQRIGYAAAGFLGKILQLGIDVVMRDQHGLFFLQQATDLVFQRSTLVRRQWLRHARPGRCDAAGAITGRSFEFNGLDFHEGFHPDLFFALPAPQVEAAH